MKYVIYIVIVGALIWHLLNGGTDISIIDNLKTMIPATPDWLAGIV